MLYRTKTLKRSLQKKTVFISGGSTGLGKILAEQFLSLGAKVIICDRSHANLIKAKKELQNIKYYVCDVSDKNQVNNLYKKLKSQHLLPDILVNNAGIISVAPYLKQIPRFLDENMQINFEGVVNLTNAFLPHFLQQKNSSIINITSIGGVIPVPHLLPYCTSKWAELGFSRTLGIELKPEGVHVLTVIPGLMRTGSFVNAYFLDNEKEYMWFKLASSLPFISLNAKRAARKIINALINKDSIITLGVPAKLIRIFDALFPALNQNILGLINYWLPKNAQSNTIKKGAYFEHTSAKVKKVSALTIAGDKAKQEHQKMPKAS